MPAARPEDTNSPFSTSIILLNLLLSNLMGIDPSTSASPPSRPPLPPLQCSHRNHQIGTKFAKGISDSDSDPESAEGILRLLNDYSRAYKHKYRHLAMELIFLCRFLVQAHEQGLNSSTMLREVLIGADDALKSAAEAGDKTSEELDKKFKDAISLLSGFEKEFPSKHPTSNPSIGEAVSRKATMDQKSESPLTLPLTVLRALEKNLHAKPMGDEWPEPTRVVKFHLLTSLPDAQPIVVELALSNNPSLQEILWNFSRFKDEKRRLTLKDNPHFYEKLPTTPEEYGDDVQIDSTESFRYCNEFYVLTDEPKLVHIMTDQDWQFFGNFWCPKNAIIFKDICGRLKGEKIAKASLRGTRCGFCEQLPASTSPITSRNHRGLQPIITEGCPQMAGKRLTGYLPMHSSTDIFLRVCAGRLAPDSPLLVPLPPTSEHPGYSVAYRTHVHVLDNDTLLQIFSRYRLEDEHNWNLRYMWRGLAHVCRRWRHLVFDSWFHLDLFLLITNNSPSIGTLGHLSPLPLVIDYSDGTRAMARQNEDNIHLGLQQHGRVRRIVLRAPSSSLRMWLEPMNKHYPRLRALSLLSTITDEVSLVLPETLQAPDLRHLALHGIGLSKKLSLLSSAIALSTLSITHIVASCYFPPRDLITQLQGLPHLEELSIGFAIPIPLPSNEQELLPAPIPPVTLPTLRRLTFRGLGVYLENLVAQINTPLLERLSLTLFFELAFILVNLTEFIHRTEGFGLSVARVIFDRGAASIHVGHYEQRDIKKLSLRVNCERLDWRIDSATQVCSALGKVLSAVEELTLDLDVDGIPPGWENALDVMLWYELLLPFTGVEKLHIRSSLALELSRALQLVTEELVLELLPELQELVVQLRIDRAKRAFSRFVATRQSVGRPVSLLNPPILAPGRGLPDSRALTLSYPGRKALTSTTRDNLTNVQILVLGKKGSGKSSLINAAFRVNMSAAPAHESNINVASRSNDSHRLIVHECSGLEPGDARGLKAIRDFLSDRAILGYATPGGLHAVWICISTSDAINRKFGEVVKEILSRRGDVPIIVAFTKFDLAFPQILGSEGGNSEHQNHEWSRAYRNQWCHTLSRWCKVPGKVVSVIPQFGALVNDLIETTDNSIKGMCSTPSPPGTMTVQWRSLELRSEQWTASSLAWSTALSVSPKKAAIEIGQWRYWCDLWSSSDFADQPLKSCVNIIHVDIVETWNLYDRNRYLSSNQFKVNMSHVVKDLAVPTGSPSPSSDWNGYEDNFADWVDDLYQGSQESVRCVIAYVVDLTMIMDGISKATAHYVTKNAALKVTNSHIRSGRRDSVHRDIRNFVTERIAFDFPQKGPVLEKIIDLIRHCDLPPG